MHSFSLWHHVLKHPILMPQWVPHLPNSWRWTNPSLYATQITLVLIGEDLVLEVKRRTKWVRGLQFIHVNPIYLHSFSYIHLQGWLPNCLNFDDWGHDLGGCCPPTGNLPQLDSTLSDSSHLRRQRTWEWDDSSRSFGWEWCDREKVFKKDRSWETQICCQTIYSLSLWCFTVRQERFLQPKI